MFEQCRRMTREKDVRVLEEKVVYQGFLSVKKLSLQVRLFSGQWSKVMTRDLVSQSMAVGVLLHDPVQRKVVLIEQFRPGTLNDVRSPWQLEIIAGLVEAKEPIEETAIREIKEEAGVKVSRLDLKPLYQFWLNPGSSNHQMHLFHAVVDTSNMGGVFGLSDEHEDIKVHVLDQALAFSWLEEGKINNAPAIIALQWLYTQNT